MNFNTVEHNLRKETLQTKRINATGVPVYSAWCDRESSSLWTQNWYRACQAFLYLESLRRENIFTSLTKIERQEIILSVEYSIIFIAVFVDKLQYQESCMHKRPVH